MAVVRCIEGMQEAADALLLDNATPENKEIFLFSNNATVTKTTVNADLTEITTNGGEKQTLVKATFGAATSADPVVSRYNDAVGIIWNITGDLTNYGWAIRGVTSLKIYWAENWGVKVVHNGNTITAQPLDLNTVVG